MFILVVDYYSKYIEIECFNNGYNSLNVITKLKSIFARHGIPNILMSDNDPSFNSKELKKLQWRWNRAYYIKSIFTQVKKSFETNSDSYVALLHYRKTPKGNMPSPSELLMSRSLPTRNVYFSPHTFVILLSKQVLLYCNSCQPIF